jgi:hypothetical protein
MLSTRDFNLQFLDGNDAVSVMSAGLPFRNVS